jgi:hypothetical protein
MHPRSDNGFHNLKPWEQRLHLGDLLLVVIAIVLIMTPAPYHRLRISSNWSTMSEMTTSEDSGGSEAGPFPKSPGLRAKKIQRQQGKPPVPKLRLKKILKVLGPGLITGAADDDPSGIATYASVGAQFGYGMLWTMLFVYPFMAGIQEISARLGRVTGRGIAGNMRQSYS